MRPTTFEVGPGAIIKVGDAVMCVKRWESSSRSFELAIGRKSWDGASNFSKIGR